MSSRVPYDRERVSITFFVFDGPMCRTCTLAVIVPSPGTFSAMLSFAM